MCQDFGKSLRIIILQQGNGNLVHVWQKQQGGKLNYCERGELRDVVRGINFLYYTPQRHWCRTPSARFTKCAGSYNYGTQGEQEKNLHSHRFNSVYSNRTQNSIV